MHTDFSREEKSRRDSINQPGVDAAQERLRRENTQDGDNPERVESIPRGAK